MNDTKWDDYGVGKYEKCADCMVHCGFEGTAVQDTVAHPWRALGVSLFGVKTTGAMAKDIPLGNERKAKYVFSDHVNQKLIEIRVAKTVAKQPATAAEGA